MIRVMLILAVVARVVLADPDTLAPVWPARAFERDLAAKGVVVELEYDPRAMISRMVAQRQANPTVRAHASLLLDRVGEPARDTTPESVLGEGANAMVYDGVWVDKDAPASGRTLVFVSLREQRPHEIERTWMAYEPATTDGVEGLAVIIPGTFGYPAELYEKWSDDLRLRGWSVLRLLSQPSRFTERVDFRIGAGEGAARGAEFAAHADDRTAECAYAVEHAARHVEALDPRLQGKPRALLGFSGGAILAPAVVAREPDRYRHVVLVAGGAHAARISIDSTFMKQYIRSAMFEFSGPDAPADRAQFEDAYLRHASMDAYHAAARFDAGTRALVVDGSLDKAVPFATSTLLYERLEQSGLRPLRRTYPTNHVLLFMALQDMLDEINAWIDGGELALPPGQEARPSP